MRTRPPRLHANQSNAILKRETTIEERPDGRTTDGQTDRQTGRRKDKQIEADRQTSGRTALTGQMERRDADLTVVTTSVTL
ncbi:unnamed protein product [Soboliphyme baturini]|uniref:Uncharacterized protein n=1 Tax=Soboliphyme baturini TaxID=241478 RepID=A0A183IL10_9BILA|nr:unnamed protein product [Soboliphyme baturini]